MTVEELRRLKDEKGTSLAGIAEMSGVPIGTVVKVFNGDSRNPRPATLAAIERALKDMLPKYKNCYGELTVKSNTRFEGSNMLKMDDTPPDEYNTGSNYDREYYGGEFTIDDYYSLPDGERFELIDGELIKMEAPSFIHQQIILEFASSVHMQIKALNGRCRAAVSPLDVRILKDDRNMLQPDALILCDKEKNIIKRVEGVPDMVLEVTSPSNTVRYMTKKRIIYTAAGVREYWIIDPMRKTLISYRIDEGYRMHMQPLEGEKSLAISDGIIKIDLDEIRKVIEEYGPEDAGDMAATPAMHKIASKTGDNA